MDKREYDLELASAIQGLTQAENAVQGLIALFESTTTRSPSDLPNFISDLFVTTGFGDAVDAGNDALDNIEQAFDQLRTLDDESMNALDTESNFDSTVRDAVQDWPNDRKWLSESAQDSDEVRRMDAFVKDYKE